MIREARSMLRVPTADVEALLSKRADGPKQPGPGLPEHRRKPIDQGMRVGELAGNADAVLSIPLKSLLSLHLGI